jgi:DNA-3-methyladenine glycosylase
MNPLPAAFYGPSAKTVAERLLGHWLVRRIPEAGWCGGMIVEAEAYLAEDPACHAFRGRTARNRVMFGPPGRAYVYFIYGNYSCVNAVCQPEGVAEAVLIRAVEPLFGEDVMRQCRPVPDRTMLTSGPGKLCQAMSIDRTLDDADLTSADSPLIIAENPDWRGDRRRRGPVVVTPRIGITRAADWPLRFYLGRSEFVSRKIRDKRPTAPPQS